MSKEQYIAGNYEIKLWGYDDKSKVVYLDALMAKAMFEQQKRGEIKSIELVRD